MIDTELHTHTHTEDASGRLELSRPPLNHQAIFLEGEETQAEIEKDVENEHLDFEWIDAQDRPSHEALVASYKRRDR
jgi:hypothetical protein